MGSLLRYLVIALFLVLGTSWIISSINGCSAKKTDTTSIIDDLDSDLDNEFDQLSEEMDAEDIADGDIDMDNMDDLDKAIADLENDLSSDAAKGKSVATKVTTSAKRPSKRVSNPVTTNRSPSKEGQYMVVAGSFGKEMNAEAMVKRLEAMGYDNSEIAQFDYSEFFSVLAGRFSTEEAARKVSSRLQEDGVQAYVHRKRK